MLDNSIIFVRGYGRNTPTLEERDRMIERGATPEEWRRWSEERLRRGGNRTFNPADAPWTQGLPPPTGTVPNLEEPGGTTREAQPAAPAQPRRGTIAPGIRRYPDPDTGQCPPGSTLVEGMCSPDTRPGPGGTTLPTDRGNSRPAVGDWIAQYFSRIVVIVIGVVLLGGGIALFGKGAFSGDKNGPA